MEELFCKQVPILFKASEREERKTFVQLQIGIQSNKHDSRKELVVKLTDDQDLFFLYTLHLAEEDFQSLKVQQGLLVDFIAFPQKFVDLLDMCIREEHKENPKFILHFVSGGNSLLGGEAPCTLNVIETNPFKHLNHLSLRFVPGSDADVKTHLANCLSQLKDSNTLIQQKFDHTSRELSSKLQQTQELLASKTSELETLKLEWSSRLTDITSKHKEDMALEKEKTVQFQSNLQIRFERERRELEQDNAKMVKQLESRLSELERNNKDLTDRKYKSESSIRDYKSRLTVLEEEHSRVKTELQTLRKDNASLDSLRHDQDKSNNQLHTRVAVLEQELRDKAELLEKSNALLISEQEKKKRTEEELEKRNKDVSKQESKVKAMGDELKKGNEIIKKLQGEIKAYHAKVKLRTQIATEQEKLLGEKDQELEKLRQELATTKDSLRDTEDKNQKLSTKLESATQKLEESSKLLKTNENMIQWLNKQINEQRVGQNHLGTFELPTAQARPAANVIHNYSTTSHGSSLSQDDPRHQASYRGMGPQGGSLPARQPQVHYQSSQGAPPAHLMNGTSHMVSRKSAIPIIHGHGQPSQNNPPPIQEEHFNSSAGSGGDRDNSRNPPIDPRFLMKREEAIPVRGLLNQHNAPGSSLILSSTATTAAPIATSLTTSQQSSQSASRPSSTSGLSRVTSAGISSSGGASVPSSIANLAATSVRLNQQMIVPKAQPPLASAYFPTQS